MNKKRGATLILSLLVTMVLSVLMVSFYFQTLSENQIAKSSAHSIRAFWLAETGVAEVKGSPGLSSTSGNLGSADYTYSAAVSRIGSTNYYRVDSTGTVAPSAGQSVIRRVSATLRTGSVDPTKFQFGIETTTDLVIKGSVDINPNDSWKEHSTLDFANLFTVSKAVMKANATHLYTSSNFTAPVDGITWVDVNPGGELTISGNLVGSGILIVNGDTKITGTVDFNGIIYVIGKLTMHGTVNTYGSVLAESSTEVDTRLTGNVEINYSVSDITDALEWVQFLTKELVSWREL